MALGLVYALDLGVRSGFAYGKPGETPRAGAVVLKPKGEHRAVAFSNLIATLGEQWSADRPELVVKERWWGLGASGERGNSQDVVYMHVGLHAIVEGMCGRFGIAWREAADSTIRKHFIGRGRMGSRDETKEAVKQRCRVLGLMPKDPAAPLYDDDNIADALAVHDWACATYAKRSVSMMALHFFDEGAGHE